MQTPQSLCRSGPATPVSCQPETSTATRLPLRGVAGRGELPLTDRIFAGIDISVGDGAKAAVVSLDGDPLPGLPDGIELHQNLQPAFIRDGRGQDRIRISAIAPIAIVKQLPVSHGVYEIRIVAACRHAAVDFPGPEQPPLRRGVGGRLGGCHVDRRKNADEHQNRHANLGDHRVPPSYPDNAARLLQNLLWEF